MTEIRLTRRALSDLKQIEKDSKKDFGKKVAARYLRDIEEALVMLSDHPGLLREKPFADYLRFYTVREHALAFCSVENVLYLLTVSYGGMDIEDIVLRLEPTLVREAEILHEKLKQVHSR